MTCTLDIALDSKTYTLFYVCIHSSRGVYWPSSLCYSSPVHHMSVSASNYSLYHQLHTEVHWSLALVTYLPQYAGSLCQYVHFWLSKVPSYTLELSIRTRTVTYIHVHVVLHYNQGKRTEKKERKTTHYMYINTKFTSLIDSEKYRPRWLRQKIGISNNLSGLDLSCNLRSLEKQIYL